MAETSPLRCGRKHAKSGTKMKSAKCNQIHNHNHEAHCDLALNHVDLPTKVFDEIHRVLDGRNCSPIEDETDASFCVGDSAIKASHRTSLSITAHSATFGSESEIVIDKCVKDEKDGTADSPMLTRRCIVCQCVHNPQSGSLDSSNDSSFPHLLLCICANCKKIIEKERDAANCSLTLKVTACNDNGSMGDCVQTSVLSSSLNALNAKNSVPLSSTNVPHCSCHICKRLEHENVKGLWQQLKIAILRIYRDSGLLLSHNFLQQSKIELPPPHSKPSIPTTEHLKEVVHRLIIHDLHKLYQCLEAQIRLFVVEMRLNLLKHIQHGSQALLEALIEFYTKLGRASKKSGQFLQELEARHLRKYNLTWELVNRRLFQSIVYCDFYIKHTLLKLKTLTDDRNFIEMYTKFIKFEDEMTVISVVWREAQQHSDDYDKYAMLSKKKALFKEWDLELVGQKTKQNDSVSSSSCLWKKKSSSIECVNSRMFMEEPKRLKSGRNMQSVNITVEAQATLQEQILLANYGEWESVDIKTLAAACWHSSAHCKNQKNSSPIDLLVNSSAKKSEANDVSDNDDDDDDEDDMDDDEDDGEDDDEDEDDEDDDESCSDQSSTTSTSTSNNQRGDGGRVCDCCYCEVFGHGMPAVAPTSRNFNEMRERLRLRLSKRKAEKGCENGNPTVAGIAVKKKDNVDVEDKRDLEELINFINGTNDEMKESKSKKKKEKQKKKKDKLKEKRVSESNQSDVVSKRDDENEETSNGATSLDELTCRSNKENSHPSEAEVNVKMNGEASCAKAKNGQSKRKNVPNVEKRRCENGDISEMNNNHFREEEQQHRHNHQSSNSSPSVANHVCNGIASFANKKMQQNIIKNYEERCKHSIPSPERDSVKMRPKEAKSVRNRGKKKSAAEEALSPDEVFLPKDIDLENGELDEFEKELEAFKRFCYNSKPLARKEKVNVNLKDIVIKKRQASMTDENDACIRK